MQTTNWYSKLIKPSFAPPSYLFGIVWPILYVIIFASYGYTFYQVFRGKFPAILVIPMLLNLVSNFLFSPIQFVLQNNLLAAVDIVVVLVSIVWFMRLVLPFSRGVFYAQIPYLMWVSFATVLQFSITWLNR
jgi:tryptophan-rich sensory protein